MSKSECGGKVCKACMRCSECHATAWWGKRPCGVCDSQPGVEPLDSSILIRIHKKDYRRVMDLLRDSDR